VFVVERGKANQRQIEIGHRSDREAEVQRGLQAKEMVILHPTEQIKDGIQVTSR
jgi:HlyD family secretion protein